MEKIQIYKCGSFYKIISTKKFDKEQDKERKETSTIGKRYNNVIRAKTTVQNLILSNNFKYFCTITVNSNYDRNDLSIIRKSINQKIRNLRREFTLPLQFILIGEQHKKGGWHLHGCLSSDFEQFIYRNQNGYLSLKIFDYLGYSNISTIQDNKKISNYVTKYITKNFLEREKGSHCYFTSHNLVRPVVLVSEEVTDVNRKFFDYENDFCKIKITDDENYITNLIKGLHFVIR